MDFDYSNKLEWTNAIHTLFKDNTPNSQRWYNIDEMIEVLMPFMAPNLNHTFVPMSGGLDMINIAKSHEKNCIELNPCKGIAYLMKPDTMYSEHFPDSPHNSFFLIEIEQIEPSGVYESLYRDHSEQVLEISPGEYVDHIYNDQGYLGHDENGNEIPLPKGARRVVRFMKGKFLIVAKRSIWNLTSSTYDGRHNQMSVEHIRKLIHNSIYH